MKRLGVFTFLLVAATIVEASWYWPFRGDDDEKEKPRFSELIEEASVEIDNAVDAAADGKYEEALEYYRKALAELERVERENPDRAPTGEFASLRNKRALVNSAIDAIILEQSRENAKAVQVTDTTELEKKFEARKRGEKRDAEPRPAAKKPAPAAKEPAPAAKKPAPAAPKATFTSIRGRHCPKATR